MNHYLNVSPEQFQALNAWPGQTSFQMLNLLKFKEQVEGGERSGKEQYQIYMEAAKPFLAQAKAKVIFYGRPLLTLIGPDKEWDKVLIVEYSSKEDFMGMITQPDYPSHLRKAALEDSRLILCVQ